MAPINDFSPPELRKREAIRKPSNAFVCVTCKQTMMQFHSLALAWSTVFPVLAKWRMLGLLIVEIVNDCPEIYNGG